MVQANQKYYDSIYYTDMYLSPSHQFIVFYTFIIIKGTTLILLIQFYIPKGSHMHFNYFFMNVDTFWYGKYEISYITV